MPIETLVQFYVYCDECYKNNAGKMVLDFGAEDMLQGLRALGWQITPPHEYARPQDCPEQYKCLCPQCAGKD